MTTGFDAGASGGSYIQGEMFAAVEIGFDLPTTGDYYLWLRAANAIHPKASTLVSIDSDLPQPFAAIGRRYQRLGMVSLRPLHRIAE